MRSVSMRPSATHESGHSYFAQTGHSHFAATLVAISLCRGEQKRTIRESERGFSMKKFGMTVTAFFLLLGALSLASSQPALTKNTILTNRIGPSGGELFIAKGDGSGEHQLNSGGNMDYDAMFSTDGKWIVFTSERNGSANIYRIHADGSGLERLTDDDGFDDQASLSPDDNQLAFVSTRVSGTNNIWILDIKTRKARNLTGVPALQAAAGKMDGFFRPSWSPDGKWIAFSSDRGTDFKRHKFPMPGFEHIQAASIYVIQSNGEGLRKLTPEGEMAGSPKWSADSKQVVFYDMDAEYTFAARLFGSATSQIISVDMATGDRSEHTSGPGLKVSPQFLSADRIGYLIKGPGQKGELAFTTGEHGAAAPAPGVIRNPAWSSDGKQVVYEKFAYDSKQNQPPRIRRSTSDSRANARRFRAPENW